ncbi:MAG TPA: hypothetical protein VEU51_05080 [Candidatus Acidoferrales bacterium]|nr:hypothetical protein [Candidatus Acidoferrales bacterium]
MQDGLFFTLAVIVASGAAIFAGAYTLSPTLFLVFSAVMALAAIFGVASAIRRAWRSAANAALAAAIADERAELKGRLSTVVALAKNEHRGALWPFLVEDTLGHQDEFKPARIERRRISRSIYAFCGAMLLALLALPMARMKPAARSAPGDAGDLAIDLNDLHLRAAEPGDDSGMEVSADPATMRRLQDKLARESVSGADGGGNSLNQLLNRARDMAGQFQSKLTGQQPFKNHLTLRLADSGNGSQQNPIHRAPDAQKNRRGEVAGQFRQEQPKNEKALNLPPLDDSRQPDSQPSPSSGADPSNELGGGKDRAGNQDDSGADRTAQNNGENSTNGGESHGIGADPDSLFGAPAGSKLGTEGFEIAIEARPLDRGAKGAGHAYVPPKVRTRLNANQAPDEPVARAAVPAEDRTTIKRVFER